MKPESDSLPNNDECTGVLTERLIASLSQLSQSEMNDVNEFFDHNELGLAVETAFAVVTKRNISVSRETIELFRRLIADMNLESRVNVNLLRVSDV